MACITVVPGTVIGPVHPRIYGSFIEHLGRVVYGGIWEEGSPLSDELGYRADVREAIREIGVTQLRYPGGNFVSAYHWRDGVGPRDHRPVRRELAWGGIDTNRFGTDEFMAYCHQLDVEPFLCVNLGTGTPEEAADWLEYCNGRLNTTIARQRAANGHPRPYNVRLWGLGNEMYGPWQIGQHTARDYALVARETAKMMRFIDPGVELIAVGHEDGPWWNEEVLSVAAPYIDHIALHLYIGSDDTADALAQPILLEKLVRQHAALADLVLTDMGLQKKIGIAVDEWNVWYRSVPEGVDQRPIGETDIEELLLPEPLAVAEEHYNLRDALAVACCLNALLRCSDVVSLANLAQIVNAIAPLHTTKEGVLREATFYPFALYSQLMRGTAVTCHASVEGYERRVRSLNTKAMTVQAPYLDTAATLDETGQTLTLAVVNRCSHGEIETELRMVGACPTGQIEVRTLTGPGMDAQNTFDHPDTVIPTRSVIDSNGLRGVRLPAGSLTLLKIPLA